jgi:WD40 repeat protein/predicted Ser/Thr protein kinase
MTEQGRARLWALFEQAADLAPAEQRALLDAACQDDPALRAAVERMLAQDARLRADEGAGDFLNSPLVRTGMAEGGELKDEEQSSGPSDSSFIPPPSSFPRHIRGYRIVGLLGEGGMGSVYEAEQENPRRPVALKVIRPNLVSPPLLKRFGQEAQILGRLHHAGIAAIYEAGLAEDGRPFFAMEFIRGLPLTEYVRSRGLTTRARLELLARVCDAVQHAHEQGVIHRDLKPANILVEEDGQPKVLDFGVAKATDADLQTTAGRTEAGQLLGTLSYMSPEQVAGDPAALDGRSDVYALGVILFELLADRLPYHLHNLPLPEVARVIREEEPSRLGSINSVFRGDVETIVGKALEKDRARRYASAGELAADVRRYLRNEAILARPPSAVYHLRMFARRHKALVAGVLGVFAALLTGTIVSLRFAWRAEHNAARADAREREATREAYRARLAAAVAALSNHDVADAGRHLDRVPSALRGWEWDHLHSRLDDSSAVFPAAAGETLFLLREPEALRAGAYTRRELRLRDLDGHELLARTFGPERKLNTPAVQTRQGLRLVERIGNTVQLLDIEGQVRTRVQGPPGEHSARVAISPDGSRVAVAWTGGDGPVRVYESDSGKQSAKGQDSRTAVLALEFSPDGTRLAGGGEDGLVRLWDTATGALVALCRGHSRKVLALSFRPDGACLVSASTDGTVRQWGAATGREVEPAYERHTGEVFAAAYGPDGQWIASGGTDRTIRVWRAAGRQDLAVRHGHTGAVTGLAFTADGQLLASLSQDRGANYAGDDTLRLWEADPRVGLPVLHGHTSYVYPVAYSPDGAWIASGSWDGTVRLWDARTGEPCAVLRHPVAVWTLAFSPDGTWLATGGDKDRLWTWDVAAATIRSEVRVPGKSIRLLAVSPDAATIAATVFDAKTQRHLLNVTEVATGKQVFSGGGNACDYSPDGRWLAGWGADEKTVVLWDARTYQRAAEWSGHGPGIAAVAFSRDGRRLASTGKDRTVRVWDVATGECVAVLSGHTDAVFTAAFHPNGTRLASAGRDRAVWLWDLETGQEVVRLPGHTSYIWSLAFSPEGKSLVSGSGDGTVRLWDTEPLAKRYQARRDALALRPAAERLVNRLFQEKKEWEAVAAVLRSNAPIDEPLRQAARRAAWRRAQRSEAAPGPGETP